MKPVMQTLLPTPEIPMQGNCFTACLASILEMSIDKIPSFAMDRSWPENFFAWLAEHGMSQVEVYVKGWKNVYCIPGGTICIASGLTIRHPERQHSVVGRIKHKAEDGPFMEVEYLHDPHPDGGFLTELHSLLFLIPLDPAEVFRSTR